MRISRARMTLRQLVVRRRADNLSDLCTNSIDCSDRLNTTSWGCFSDDRAEGRGLGLEELEVSNEEES